MSFSSAYRSVLFDVVADAEPGLLPRALVPFARRDLTPDHVKARRIGDRIEATFGLEAMPSDIVHLIERNLRQIVGVRRVEVVWRAAVREAA